MIGVEVLSVNAVTTALCVHFGDQEIELRLSPSPRGGVDVHFAGTSVVLEFLANEIGVLSSSRHPLVDPEVFEAARCVSTSYAIENLDMLSHSLEGTREERLAILERLALFESRVPRQVPKKATQATRLPAAFLFDSPLGRMVVTFGHASLADIGPADEENPSRSNGSIRFRRNPEYGWLPANVCEWEIRNWPQMPSGETAADAVGMLLPLVIMADALRREKEASPVLESRLIRDIDALKRVIPR